MFHSFFPVVAEEVKTQTAANEVLPKLIARHNRKFAVNPAEGEDVYVKPEGKVDLDFLFARRESRRTDHGGMISYGGRRYVPAADDCLGMAQTTVEVRETSTGRIWGVSKGRRIEMKEVESQKRVNSDEASAKKRKSGLVKAHTAGILIPSVKESVAYPQHCPGKASQWPVRCHCRDAGGRLRRN
ncbi:hypothetical protein RAH42_13040 [Pyramidobacter sp. YE332]|uniref:hypothetical protein n=1 Tax=Pyramidobacter sp. YE332 TaxID=3068894 RepID=UPI00294AE0B5|nr:hypothetical protein [Pyramidobacter sp. YE332]WOL40041.1 hypothetical protein RAH42_13040 [Pyramidobacter sp. YE332]